MASNVIFLEHPETGHLKLVSLGYCWPLLQWGALLPLRQRRWKWSLLVATGALATFGVSNVLLGFRYNRLHLRELLAAGYRARAVSHGTLEQLEARLALRLHRLPSLA